MSRGNVESGRSNEARFAIELGAPAAPLDLVAVPSPSQVLLQWRRGSLAIGAGFVIYRNGERIGGIGDPDMPAFLDVQVRPLHHDRLLAVLDRGLSHRAMAARAWGFM
jgi:hypothetical protein